MTSSGIESKSAILARTKTAVNPKKDVTRPPWLPRLGKFRSVKLNKKAEGRGRGRGQVDTSAASAASGAGPVVEDDPGHISILSHSKLRAILENEIDGLHGTGSPAKACCIS